MGGDGVVMCGRLDSHFSLCLGLLHLSGQNMECDST